MTRTGVSYFGVRIPRHARRDLEDIAARGYTAVLHTFSENDLAYYRGTMAEIVAASHELGLEVQMCPWGVGRTFGGEAESRWVTFHPEACQVLDDGRRVATGCLNNPAYRAFCKEWADAAVEAGTDYVFWDEPHWTVPEHVGRRRSRALGLLLRRLPGALRIGSGRWSDSRKFRRSVKGLSCNSSVRCSRTSQRAVRRTRSACSRSPTGLTVSATGTRSRRYLTSPCWRPIPTGRTSTSRPSPSSGASRGCSAETAARHGVDAQMWLPSFGLTREEIPELESAIAATRAAGIDDVWTWGYEACGHMTKLATPDAPLVWEAVTKRADRWSPNDRAAPCRAATTSISARRRSSCA